MLKFWRYSGNWQQLKDFKVNSSYTPAVYYYCPAEFPREDRSLLEETEETLSLIEIWCVHSYYYHMR